MLSVIETTLDKTQFLLGDTVALADLVTLLVLLPLQAHVRMYASLSIPSARFTCDFTRQALANVYLVFLRTSLLMGRPSARLSSLM
jgi:hypothetical protein